MTNFYKLLFFLTLMLGILISISSYSWLSIWMGLEINLLSILPLMTNSKNMYPSESALKYFISQVIASILFLFSLIMIFKTYENFMNMKNLYMEILIDSAILTKMGAAPFHFWFPEVAEGLNWKLNLIMMTLQKIAPMIILIYICNHYFYLSIIIILSAMVSGLMGLNQMSLRKIMAYSSINHLAWMLSAMTYSNMYWLLYFLIYSITALLIVYLFEKFNIYYTKQLYNTNEINKTISMLIIFLFFSLSGLPPFLGFFPKWMTIMNLISYNQIALSLTLIIFTLLVFSFYLRLILMPMLFYKNELNMKIEYNNSIIYILQIMNLLSLPMMFMIFI